MTQSTDFTITKSLPNPFLGGIVPDAWRGSAADVAQIHADVFAQCLAAVDRVRASGESASVLVHGEQGSGKTHLLSRLQRHLTDRETYPDLDDVWQIFVYLRMRTSSGRIWRKIRTELVSDLMRPMPDGLTQLDHVLAKRLAVHCDGHDDLALWWNYYRQDRMEQLVDTWHEVAATISLRDDFRQVIEWFIRGEHRRHVRAFLGGGLVTETGFRAMFGNVDASHYAPDHEDDAFAAVVALCHVAGPQIPIVFCFDQIEAIEVEDAKRKPVWYLAQAVANLSDEAPVAAISCVLAAFANDEIRAQDRPRLISGGETALQRLDAQQMRWVIRSRVTAHASTAAAAGKDGQWPFADTDPLFQHRCTPRELLHQAATRFDQLRGLELPPDSDTSQPPPLAAEFEKRVEAAIRDQKPEDTDALIAATLPQLMPIIEPGWTVDYPVGPHNSKHDIEMVLVGPAGEARVGVALCNQPNMTSLAAQLNRLLQHRDAFGLQKLVIVRDGRLPISPGARATHERLNRLTQEDGVLVRPTREVMAVLDAIGSLLADATCGDLSLAGQSIGASSVRDWLADHLDSTIREWVEHFRTPTRPGFIDDDSNDADLDAIVEYLSDQPLASIDDLSTATGVSTNRIVELAGSAADQVGIVTGEPSVVFRVVASDFEESEGGSTTTSADRSTRR